MLKRERNLVRLTCYIGSVLVTLGCYNKYPTLGISDNRTLFLTVLEAGV